jgi:hypothetical protein
VSTSWSATTIPSAHSSSEYVPAPNTLANVLGSPSTLVPGVGTGCASEMISVKPWSASSIPSVVTNEAIPMTAVKKPFTSPTSRHAPSASARAGMSGRPSSWNSWKMNGANR